MTNTQKTLVLSLHFKKKGEINMKVGTLGLNSSKRFEVRETGDYYTCGTPITLKVGNRYKEGRVEHNSRFFPMSVFVAVEYWYGIKEKMGAEFFLYSKKYGSLYDTYALFD